MSENYVQRVAKGSFFVFILTILGLVLGFALRSYLSKNLTLEAYGIFFTIMAFVGVFDIFRGYGLEISMTKFIPEFLYEKKEWKIKSFFISFSIIEFTISLIIFIPIFIFSDTISIFLFKTIEASIIIKFFSFVVFLNFLFRPVISSLAGFQKLAMYSASESIRIILIFIPLIFLIPLGLIGVTSAYLVSVIGILAIYLIYYFRTFKDFFKIKFEISKPLMKKMFAFGMPFYIGSIATIVATQFDTLLITFFHGAEQAGLYNAALPTSKLLWSIFMPLALVLFPLVSEMWVKKQKDLISKGTALIIKILLICILPFVIIIISFPEIILTTIFDSKFLPAVMPLQILCISTVFYSVFVVGNSIIGGIGESVKAGKTTAVMSIMTIVLYFGLIPILGIIGAAISVLIASIIAMIMVLRYLKRYIELKIRFFDVFKILLGGFFVALIIFIVKYSIVLSVWYELSISVAIGLAFYILYIFYVKCITKEDLGLLSAINIKPPSFISRIIGKLVK